MELFARHVRLRIVDLLLELAQPLRLRLVVVEEDLLFLLLLLLLIDCLLPYLVLLLPETDERFLGLYLIDVMLWDLSLCVNSLPDGAQIEHPFVFFCQRFRHPCFRV